MFRRIADTTISLDEWIDLNTSEIPTELLTETYRSDFAFNEERELHRLDNICSTCDGTGNGAEDDVCNTCEGEGTDPEQRDLYGFPFAHSTCWVLDDVTPSVVEALIASGFVVYHCEGGPFDGRHVFGVDGGGYSFRGAHWIPLRLRLAHAYAEWCSDVHSSEWVAYRAIASKLLDLAAGEGEHSRIEKLVSNLAGAPSC